MHLASELTVAKLAQSFGSSGKPEDPKVEATFTTFCRYFGDLRHRGNHNGARISDKDPNNEKDTWKTRAQLGDEQRVEPEVLLWDHRNDARGGFGPDRCGVVGRVAIGDIER